MKIKYGKESEILKALAHPVRLQIIEAIAKLRKNECSVTTIQKNLGLPQSTISQHLRTLRNKGIIDGSKKGVEVCYKVIDKRIKEIMQILKK